MNSNFETPPVWSNKMPRTPEAVKNVRRLLAAKGLLHDSSVDFDDFDLDEQFEDLKRELAASNRVSMKRRGHVRACNVLIRLFMDDRETDAAVIIRAIEQGKIVPPSSRCWDLACFLYDQDGLGAGVQAKILQAIQKRTGVNVTSIARAPDAVASMMVSSGFTLNEVDDKAHTIPGSPLNIAVWARLLSLEAAPWVVHHPWSELETFLQSYRETERVGLIGRQLFEPTHNAGLEPGDVGPGSEMAKLVELIVKYLPYDRGLPAWRALGEKAKEVIDWCERQKKLDEYFGKWDATSEKQRGQFWRQYIRRMRDLKPWDSANAIGMLIDEFWYIEFGGDSNACYRYTKQQFSELERKLRKRERDRRVISESHLKNPKGDLNTEEYFKLSHYKARGRNPGWQKDFEAWIEGRIGGIRQESPQAALRRRNGARRRGW
jgi:hypothetical protein